MSLSETSKVPLGRKRGNQNGRGIVISKNTYFLLVFINLTYPPPATGTWY